LQIDRQHNACEGRNGPDFPTIDDPNPTDYHFAPGMIVAATMSRLSETVRALLPKKCRLISPRKW
jgi:hypothetical protein